MINFNEQKKIKIKGVEYTLQMLPAQAYFDLLDRAKDKEGNPVSSKIAKEFLEHVVINPSLTVNDFTGKLYQLTRLSNACEKFIMGEELGDDDFEEVNEKNAGKPKGKED